MGGEAIGLVKRYRSFGGVRPTQNYGLMCRSTKPMIIDFAHLSASETPCHGGAVAWSISRFSENADPHHQLHRQQPQNKAQATVNNALQQFVGTLLFRHQLLKIAAGQQAR